MRDSFIFYRSFYDALEEADQENQLIVYRAIARYALDREEPALKGLAKIIWSLVKPQLDANWKRFENGKKGGAPTGNKNNRFSKSTTVVQPKYNQDTTGVQPNVFNVNDNVNDNDNVSASANKNRSDKPTRFVPPTLNEVQDYILKNEYSVDADRFVNFYEAKGWMIGKNKMKDWKAAVRTWQREQKKQKPDEIGMVLRDNSIDKFEKDRNNLW